MSTIKEEPSRETQLTVLQAQLCKTLSHVKRLQIIRALENGERCVGDLVEELELPYANLSQHLRSLRQVGLIEVRHEGKRSYYRLATPRIARACAALRGVLRYRLEKLGQLAQTLVTHQDDDQPGGKNEP